MATVTCVGNASGRLAVRRASVIQIESAPERKDTERHTLSKYVNILGNIGRLSGNDMLLIRVSGKDGTARRISAIEIKYWRQQSYGSKIILKKYALSSLGNAPDWLVLGEHTMRWNGLQNVFNGVVVVYAVGVQTILP